MIQNINKFAFIANPHDISCLFETVLSEPKIKNKRTEFIESGIIKLPPFKRSVIEIKSEFKDANCKGIIILLPLTANQMISVDKKIVFSKTLQGCIIAKELGAKIIGLGAYVAEVGKKGVEIEKQIKMPVTTGTCFTITTAIDATYKAAELLDIDLNSSTISIVGATGSIGSICSQILSKKVKVLKLIGRNLQKLNMLVEKIRQTSNSNNILKIEIHTDITEGIKNADIILVSTNTPSTLIKPQDIPSGCIVCDISVPKNVSKEAADVRDDVLVIDGGLVKPPSEVNLWYLDLPPNTMYACLSEVSILTLEGLFESFSLGGNISLEKVIKIKQLAEKHGFKLAEFTSFGKPVTKEKIEKVKLERKKR